ncbi:hypothetical protein NGB58_26990, partial [Escherichia coli]|nr:hypothetical protein [Escherichia coli]
GIVEPGAAHGAGNIPVNLPADILRSANQLSPFPDRFVIPFLLFITGITPVLACFPECLHRLNKIQRG